MKCPPQAYVLTNWSPASDAILGGVGNFRRWGLAGGSRFLGYLWMLYLFPDPFFILLPVYHKLYSLLLCSELSCALFLLNLTEGNWRCRKDKRWTNMHKAGARCAGCSDGDAQQPHYVFSLITLLLLCFFSSLFFKALLLKSFFKTLLLFYSLKSLSLDSFYPMFSLISLNISVFRLALSHISSNL
jgi:hypothetical protein